MIKIFYWKYELTSFCDDTVNSETLGALKTQQKTRVDAEGQMGGLFWTFSVCPWPPDPAPDPIFSTCSDPGLLICLHSIHELPYLGLHVRLGQWKIAAESQGKEKNENKTCIPLVPCPFRSRCGHFLPFSSSSPWLTPTRVVLPNSAHIFINNAFIQLFSVTSILPWLLLPAGTPHRYTVQAIKDLKSHLPFQLTLHLVSIIIYLEGRMCAFVSCFHGKQRIYVPFTLESAHPPYGTESTDKEQGSGFWNKSHWPMSIRQEHVDMRC